VGIEGRRLAAELRRLVADLATEDHAEADLAAVADTVAELRAGLEGTPRGRSTRAFADHSVFRGAESPLAPPMVPSEATDADGCRLAVGSVRVGRAYEGPPGAVHGGYVAGLFDDVCGGALRFTEGPAVTGRLTVRYRQPTPVDTDLRFEAWIDADRGRRIVVRARCLADGRVTAEAEALFVRVRWTR
jgi:acyl-coenzyme A thioesterase PaaI-like protein